MPGEGKYAAAERFYDKAVAAAQRLDDRAALIRTRFWLADCQRMQSRDREALATYTWLIEVASDPHQSRDLPEASHWQLAEAFMGFVACGRFLPEMPAARLLQVIDAGLDWLAQDRPPRLVGGPAQSSRQVFRMQGRFEEARVEFETALAQAKRTPDAPGYTLASHVLDNWRACSATTSTARRTPCR